MISEEELIRRCKENDRQAQKELFDRFSAKMMAVCIRYCGNHEDAKDVLQDGFYNVLTKIGTFKGNSRLETWMTRLFINVALNSFRQKFKKYRHDEITDDMPDEVIEEGTEQYDTNKVMSALQELPDIYRVVINMYAIDNMSHAEIAKALRISEGSSKSRLSRARKLLKEKLN